MRRYLKSSLVEDKGLWMLPSHYQRIHFQHQMGEVHVSDKEGRNTKRYKEDNVSSVVCYVIKDNKQYTWMFCQVFCI